MLLTNKKNDVKYKYSMINNKERLRLKTIIIFQPDLYLKGGMRLNMSKKNFVKSFIGILLILCLVLFPNIATAEEMPTLYFGITELRESDMGYAIRDPGSVDGTGAKIWNIVQYDSETSSTYTQTNVYCVKAGVGFVADDAPVNKEKDAYKFRFDMYEERDEIAKRSTVLNELVNEENYNGLLAVANLLYIPGEESSDADKQQLLENSGVAEYQEQFSVLGENSELYYLTDDEIEAIQQVAVWHFTNGETKYDPSSFSNSDVASWLYYTTSGDSYESLSSYRTDIASGSQSPGYAKQVQAQMLYDYLVDTAEANASQYEEESTITHKNKLTLYTSATDAETQPLMVIEKIPQEFDLALRKYITAVNDVPLESTVTRVPNINDDNLANGTDTTATYNHRKDPVTVELGNSVTYNITIYNEGDIAGRATQIIDQLPRGLTYSEILTAGFSASYDSATNRLTITRDETNTENLDAYSGTTLDQETIQIKCTVDDTNESGDILTNVAWISEEVDENGTEIINQTGVDRDSEPGTAPDVNQDNMENYNGHEDNKDDDLTDSDYFYKGQQDDDDFEKLIVQNDIFDLALKKRITAVNGEAVPERIQGVDITNLANGSATTADYQLNKEPVTVETGDLVTYTFRIYNEGNIDGYAEEITEDIPEGLEFLGSTVDSNMNPITDEDELAAVDFNTERGWAYVDGDTTRISTDYLGRGKGEEITTPGANLIEAFDPNSPYTDTETEKNPDYKEISVIFKVVATDPSIGIITNEAAITEDVDSEGNPVDDRDSDTEEFVRYEDDEDYDRIILQEFDLALRKFITKVDEEDVTTRVPEVSYDREQDQITYNHTKEPVEVVTGNVVEYTIRVYNEGDMAGYATEITDDIPEGLKYLPENATNVEYRWVMYDEEGNITENVEDAVEIRTDYLSKEQEETEGENLLQAFNPEEPIGEGNPDYRDIKIAFEVVEPNTSDKIIVNSAQISEDSDENGNPVEDKDSVPDEWNEGDI